MIVVSPHLDDAALSVGRTIAALDDVTVLTVLAGIPDSELPLTNYDVQSGFTSAREAVETRCREDRRACAVLDARPLHLDFLDRQYGAGEIDTDALVACLIDLFRGVDAVMLPLGLRHPDHEIVARCARAATRRHSPALLIYEELPARVLWPEEVADALARVTDEGWKLSVASPAQGSRARKAAAVACYESQAWALDADCLYVPERLWEAQWTR